MKMKKYYLTKSNNTRRVENLENVEKIIITSSSYKGFSGLKNRNVIETVVHTALTKRELIDLINKSFPDEEVGNHGQIAQLSTTTMSDGTKMQNVCFGKILKV